VVVQDLSYFQNEEARMQRELEVQEKRIRKELVKQDILRQKVLIRFGLDLFFSSVIIFILFTDIVFPYIKREEQIKKEMERQERERQKEEERLLRERQREEDRLLREQRREQERREKFLQKESIRVCKIVLPNCNHSDLPCENKGCLCYWFL
jgi:large-conductance mechanosensitive channel